MTSSRAPSLRRLAAAFVAAAGVCFVLPTHAAASIEPFVDHGHASSAAAATTAGAVSTYHPVTAFTAYRSAGRLSPGHWRTVPLASRGGLPAAGSFDAVAVAVTLSQPTGATDAALSAAGATTRTRVVTAASKRTVTGFSVVPVTRSGTVRALLTGGHARLRIVVEGYQSPGSGGETFHALAPATVLSPHRVAAGASRSVTIVGAPRTGLPPNGHVAAVALAVTAAGPSASTTVTAYPRGAASGTGQPVVSGRRGVSSSGVGVVEVGAHGDVTLRNAHGHATLSAQVEGYWTTDRTGSSLRSLTPTTVYAGSTAANAWRSIRVAGRRGLPSAGRLTGAVLSLTVGPASRPSYLAVTPARHGFPGGGPVSVPAHTTVTTSVLAPLTGSSVHVYANRHQSLTVSVVGYYGRTADGTDVNAGAGSCSAGLPAGAGFAVIRATNGQPYGNADTSCFTAELSKASGLASAPEFYMNLADPGKASSTHWAKGGPKACHAATDFDPGCAYDYGYLAAEQAVDFAATNGAVTSSRWWIDVEVDNSWGQKHLTSPPAHQAANVADIQGALRYLSSHGHPAGVYTETAWWTAITGGSKGFEAVPSGAAVPTAGRTPSRTASRCPSREARLCSRSGSRAASTTTWPASRAVQRGHGSTGAWSRCSTSMSSSYGPTR